MHLYSISKKQDLSPGWQQVVGDRPFVSGIFADWGPGDTVVAFLYFKDHSTLAEEFIVSDAEVFRPCNNIYNGPDPGEASAAFFKTVNSYLDYDLADDEDEFLSDDDDDLDDPDFGDSDLDLDDKDANDHIDSDDDDDFS